MSAKRALNGNGTDVSRIRTLGRHGTSPAVSTLLGAAVGYVTNVVSSNATLATVIGLVLMVLTWSAWEAWRATRHRDRRAATSQTVQTAETAADVRQEAGTVTGDASLIGARSTGPISGVRVQQRVDTVDGAAEVVGVDLTGPGEEPTAG